MTVLEACTLLPTVTSLDNVPTSVSLLMLLKRQPDRGHMLVCSASEVQGKAARCDQLHDLLVLQQEQVTLMRSGVSLLARSFL